MRMSDWSSDVGSSDLRRAGALEAIARDIGDGARADIDVHVQEHAVHVDARLAGLHIFGFAEGQPVPVERIAGVERAADTQHVEQEVVARRRVFDRDRRFGIVADDLILEERRDVAGWFPKQLGAAGKYIRPADPATVAAPGDRSEEHTSELQS